MKVIFNEFFKSELERLDGFVDISKFSLEYRPLSPSGSQTKEDWLEEPVISNVDFYSCEGIWREEEKRLSLYFMLPEKKNGIEILVNGSGEGEEEVFPSEFNIIRFYYNNDQTAFILIGEVIKNETRVVGLNNIVLSQTKNLFDIAFPKTTKAKVKTKELSNDSAFLEGVGITGENIFKELNEGLIEKKSYYKYIKIETTEDYKNSIIPYINSGGERITDNFVYRVYTKIELSCSDLKTKARYPYIRYGLSKGGGFVQLHGTADYIDYRYIQGKIYKENEGVESIDGIPGLSIKELNKGLDSRVDQYSRQVIYGQKTEDVNCSADYWAEVIYYDYLQEKPIKVSSNAVRLTQQQKNLDWAIVDDFEPKYTEEDIPVFIFEYDSFSSKERFILPVYTYLPVSVENINFTYSNPEEKELISCSAELHSIDESGRRVFNIIIETLSDNNGRDWRPIIDGESRLSKITVSYEDYDIYFYAIQKANVSSLVIGDFNGGKTRDKQQVLHSLVFENTQNNWKSLYLTVSGVSSEEELEPDSMWKIINKPDQVFIKRNNEPITYSNIGWDETSCGENGFYIENEFIPEDAYDVDQGYIVFRRINPDEKDETFSENLTWNDAVVAKRLSVLVKKIGNNVSLSIPENIEIDKPGPFKINIKSNCRFKCNIKLDRGGHLYFYKTGNQSYTSTEYNNVTGVDVWVIYENDNTEEPVSENIGSITVIAAVDGKETKVLTRDIKTNYSTTPATELISDLSLDAYSKYMFLGSFENINKKIRCLFVPNQTTEPDTYSGVVIGKIKENYREANDGGTVSLLNHEINIKRTDVVSTDDFYPVLPITHLTLKTTKDSDNKLNYYLFKKAAAPKINVYPDEINLSNITKASLFSTVNSSTDIIIKTRYKFSGEGEENGWSVKFEEPYSNSFEYTIEEPESEDTRDDSGFYTYILHLKTKSIPGIDDLSVLGGEKMGQIMLISRILTSTTADNLVDSSLIEETDRYDTIDQDFTDNLVGFDEFIFDVIQSGYPYQQAETLTVKGPRGIYVPCSGSKLEYTLAPHWDIGQFTLDKFTIIPSEGNLINLISDQTGTWIEGYEFVIGQWFNAINTRSPYNIDTEYDKYKDLFNTREIIHTLNLPITEDKSFNESFLCTQEGIKDGLLLWNPSISERPQLYIDLMKDNVYNVSSSISGTETEIKLLVGLVDITKTDFFDLDISTIEVIQLDNNPGFSWEFTTNQLMSTYSKSQEFFYNLILRFPTNTYFNHKSYKIQISAQGEICTHSVLLNIQQTSGKGSLYCEKEAYFYSDGTCFSVFNPEDVGIFRFDSDLSIESLMIEVLDEQGDPINAEITVDYYDILNKQSDIHPGCNSYKAAIKLKPNKSGKTLIGDIRIYQLQEGDFPILLTTSPIKLMQGHYSLKIYSPTNLENYIFDSQEVFGPFTVHPESSEQKLVPFHIELIREEPDGYGSWIKYTPDIDSFSIINNYNWELDGSVAPISNYLAGNLSGEGYRLEGFRTELKRSSEAGENLIPFLENKYDVRSEYIHQELLINVKLKCEARYPTSDIVLKDTLVVFDSIIQLLKPAQ